MEKLAVVGTVRARKAGAGVGGYSVDVGLRADVVLAGEVLQVPVSASARLPEDGQLHLDISANGDLIGPVDLAVAAPQAPRCTGSSSRWRS